MQEEVEDIGQNEKPLNEKKQFDISLCKAASPTMSILCKASN
jgi:hypothetical protein